MSVLSAILSKDPLVTCVRCRRLVAYSKTQFYPHTTQVGAPVADIRTCTNAHADECESAVAKLYPDPISRFIAVRPR